MYVVHRGNYNHAQNNFFIYFPIYSISMGFTCRCSQPKNNVRVQNRKAMRLLPTPTREIGFILILVSSLSALSVFVNRSLFVKPSLICCLIPEIGDDNTLFIIITFQCFNIFTPNHCSSIRRGVVLLVLVCKTPYYKHVHYVCLYICTYVLTRNVRRISQIVVW